MSFKEIEALKSLKHDNIVEFVKEDREVHNILLTCACNIDPLTPHFCIVKLGFYRGIHYQFSYF